MGRTPSRRRNRKPRPSSARRKPLRQPRAGGQRPALPPKLTAPRPTRLFPRARLFDLLDWTREDHRVIWISAPGGAGKTSLATSYLDARKLPVLWYQVDQGDGDIASFFYYMGLAAKHVAPRHKTPLPLLTPEYLADVPTFTRNFFRELYRRLPKHSVIVLDNYQDAPEDSPLHDVLHTAMGEVPEGLNLFVLSRVEPPSVLARLRLCDHAACLDWDKLQLTREETEGISAVRMGDHRLHPDTLNQLHDRTQGWAAGVVLMLEQSQSGATLDTSKLPTNQKLLFDYFAGEILNRSDPLVREFLLKTALFPKVSANAARALTGIAQAQDILDDLTRRNYFTVRHTGPAGDTYQYHPLFREFLLVQAELRYGSEGLNDARRHAAGLLEEHGEVESTITLRQQAQDWEGTARLVTAQAPTLLAQGRAQLLLRWLEGIPRVIIDQRPWLSYWEGVGRLAYEPPLARALLENAYAGFKQQRDAVGVYATWSAIIESYVYEWASVKPMLRWIEEFDSLSNDLPLSLAPELEEHVACALFLALMYARPKHPGMLYWAKRAQEILLSTGDTQLQSSFAPHVLLYCTWWLGDLAKAELILNTLKPRMTSSDIVPIANITWLANAAAFYWMTAASEDCVNAAERGLALADKHGIHIWDMFLCSQGTFGKMFARGEPDSADVFLNRMASLLIPSRSLDSSFYFYLKAAKHFFVNELQQAEECARQGAFHCEQSGWLWGASHMKMTLGRMLFHRGKHVEGLTMVRESRAEDATNVPACHLNTQEYLSYLAEAEFALVLGDEAGCANALRQSLAVAQRHGFLNHTWWQPLLMSRLYAIALTHDIEPEYVRRIITLRALTPPADAPVPDTWPYPVKLHTLGRFTVTRDDQPLSRSAAHQKPLALLQALVALGGREVDEDKLAELFWPEAEGDASRQNLKINVHRLRKLLPKDALVWTEGKLSLDAHRVWVDLWALERELNRLDQASPAAAAEQTALTQQIFRLYRGAFLPENTAPWALAARERLRNKTLRIIARVAEAVEDRDPAAAVPIYEKTIELDPLRESLYQGLMRCYQTLHQPAEVEHVYRRCHNILKRELGVAPSPATEALHQTLKTDE